MAQTSQEFKALLARARQGDGAALTQLIEQYEREIRIAARVRLGPALRSQIDSMDVVQSVHRAIIVGLKDNKFDLSSPENLLALAVTMVRNRVARYWRRTRRQRTGDVQPVDFRDTQQVLVSLSCRDDDPARAAELRDQVNQIWKVLDETERRLIELRLQGHSTADVGRLLGLDADFLRVRLSRLRQRLKAGGVGTGWL
jgi:RNA polymerase sigma-70 factor (ECF subfamily)